MDIFIGTICAFGFNYAPYQWALCQGQLIAIQQNTALFALLGTQYGGDGVRTFALPNLQNNVAIGMGSNGMSNYNVGETGGMSTVSINYSNMPAHTHAVNFAYKADGRDDANLSNPQNAFPGLSGAGKNDYKDSASNGTFMGAPTVTLGNTGGQGTPISIVDPNLVLNYSIAMYGIFPSRQ
jgi:microcystin-dependent protein